MKGLLHSVTLVVICLCSVTLSDPQPSSGSEVRGGRSGKNEDTLLSSSLIFQAGETANLPCDISVPSKNAPPNDELMLIMWYREDVRSPIYSIDARSGIHIPSVTDVSSSSHWMDTNIFGHNRVVFDTSPGPEKARLKIFNVSESDDGIYRCRVDFKASQTRTSRLNLTVVVPPSKPRIFLADSGQSVEGYLGPYQIGTRLSLVCQVNGGKPSPRVVWYRNGRIFSTAAASTVTTTQGLVTVNNITLESLGRDDVHTKLTCQTTNFEATTLRSSVELDMKYQAHNVTIHNKERSLRAGSQHEFTCEALGSRPAAGISWWFDDQQIQPEVDKIQITSLVSGELSTSTMTYTPRSEDSGKTLHCRATNPEMHQGVLEDQWKLDVQYPPKVTIRMGKSLVASDIREGVDVYFNCVILANPPPRTKIVTWLHNNQVLKQNRDDDLRARMVLPSVNDPNVLVLQGVKKAARGNYSCRVGNGIPTHDYEVESQPIFLDVKFPPVCKPKGVKVYGVAKMETAHIACNVEANPPEVSFRWTFNNSAEAKTVSSRFIRTNGSTSLLTFTPTRTLEYGTLMCWSRNSVGEQRDPCIFHIIAAGKPEAVQNCTVTNESTDSFQVTCQPGFNGGLPQHFTLTVYKVAPDNGELNLAANLSSSMPIFTVSGLDPGSKYIGELVGHNVKGMGVPTQIHVYTLKLPEKLIPNIEDGGLGSDDEGHQMELDPLMLTMLGVVAGVLIVIIIVTLAIRIHASRSRGHQPPGGGRQGGRGVCRDGSGSGNQGGNKVVVTTIEELDIDHNSSTASLMVMDHGGSEHSVRSAALRSSASASTGLTVAVSKNPDLVPFIQQQQNQSVFSDDFSLLRHSRQQQPREYLTMQVEPGSHNGIRQQQHRLHRRSSIEATTNPSSKDLTPPPPPPPMAATAHLGAAAAGGCRLGIVRHPLADFCTLRRAPAAGGSQRRAVQFADQQNTNFGDATAAAHPAVVIAAVPPPESGIKAPFPMYATMRPPPPPRTTTSSGGAAIGGELFPEFVPPPPPMFEGQPLKPPPPMPTASGKPDKPPGKPILPPGKGKGEKKRESTV